MQVFYASEVIPNDLHALMLLCAGVLQVIGQLEVQTPMPRLFMRMVITAVLAMPKLRPFVMQLLERLIAKQVGRSCRLLMGWVCMFRSMLCKLQ